jgi:hypothetical protein
MPHVLLVHTTAWRSLFTAGSIAAFGMFSVSPVSADHGAAASHDSVFSAHSDGASHSDIFSQHSDEASRAGIYS